MRKNQLYLFITIILLISTLFIYEIATIGNGDIFGGLFIAFISILIPILIYKGIIAFKWVGVVGFSFMVIVTILSALENDEYLFYVMMLGYAYLVWQLLLIKSSIPNDNTENEGTPNQILTTNQQTNSLLDNQRNYPLLIKRIQALFIDSMLLLIVMMVVMVLSEESPNATEIRVSVMLILVLSYEPLLTAYSSTLGQKLIGIRVKDYNDPSKRINLLQAYIRMIVKSLLGWLSFVTIHANPDRRAIHDLVASSVMVSASTEIKI